MDWTRCDGHGSCSELLPGLLVADEWGYPLPTGERVRGDAVLPPEDLPHARRAVAACPLMALRINETA
ncbi:ferredoxin [Spongisporangium articulatum]|uniref:Ferredoxin n=1 Tax=Spongisporangium articulatum TaxID=3362603 RepID=A0ABW8AT96_9ACTN